MQLISVDPWKVGPTSKVNEAFAAGVDGDDGLMVNPGLTVESSALSPPETDSDVESTGDAQAARESATTARVEKRKSDGIDRVIDGCRGGAAGREVIEDARGEGVIVFELSGDEFVREPDLEAACVPTPTLSPEHIFRQ